MSHYQDNQGRPRTTNNSGGYEYTNAYSTSDPAPAFAARKKGRSKKMIIAIIAVILVVGVAAVLGGVLGSRASKSSPSVSAEGAVVNPSGITKTAPGASVKASGASGSDAAVATGAAAIAAAAKEAGLFATATDSYMNPIYPTATQNAAYVVPTYVAANVMKPDVSCTADTFTAGTESDGSITVRKDHPRLFGTTSDWNCLPSRIKNDAYLASWDATIMANATAYLNQPPQAFVVDGEVNGTTKGLGDSGILDPARVIGLRMKHWAYAYRMTKDAKWADRAYLEMLTASGNNPDIPFGPAGDNWNSIHFLDTAEMTLAFAYGYDWFYDAWNSTQSDLIRSAIVNLGLKKALAAYTLDPSAAAFSWWTTVTGNWNCVPAGGMTAGLLAVYHEDDTGTAAKLLPLIIANANANCLRIAPDGVTSETPDYWYFQSTGAATLQSALLSATGDVHGTMGDKTGTLNNIWSLVADFHMYVVGLTSKFNYGDHGPNKFVATANCLMFWGNYNKQPKYTLYQRDRSDAAEPLSMFFYNEDVAGAWWNGLPLDRYFPEPNSSFASMRSSWTNNQAIYAAIKASNSLYHNAHQDLDIGDFVIDAMGERWAGELGSGNYLADGYFSNDTQASERWFYYRKRTEGQNTLNIVGQNQIVGVTPFVKFETTGETQGASTATTFDSNSAVYFRSDNTGAYTDASSVKRGLRLINQRGQILVQDEFTTSAATQWRMHTNATINLSDDKKKATLTLNGKTMIINLSSASGNAVFGTAEPVALSSDPILNQESVLDGFGNQVQESINQPNQGVSVLTIDVGAGTETLYTSFEPQWDGANTQSKTPAHVALEDWSLTSHV